MKGLILILTVIAAVIIAAGAAGYLMGSETADSPSEGQSAVSKIADTVSDVSEDSGQVSEIVSEEIKFNKQNGEGFYREVTYADGGFRQYDSESGDLIGSSYDSDQDLLPDME